MKTKEEDQIQQDIIEMLTNYRHDVLSDSLISEIAREISRLLKNTTSKKQ